VEVANAAVIPMVTAIAVALVGLSLLGLGLGMVRMVSALPIGYVVVSLFCGRMEMGLALWSWPVKYAGDPIAAALAASIFACGAVVFLWRTPRPRAVDEDL
jgi:hypothetical protein